MEELKLRLARFEADEAESGAEETGAGVGHAASVNAPAFNCGRRVIIP